MFEEVKAFIESTILQSDIWDSSDEQTQVKAVNNAVQNLRVRYGKRKEIPPEAVAYQTLWLLQIDDSIRRAGQGVTSISVGGMSISLSSIDRSLAPEVLQMLGRRVGRYGLGVEDTFRHRTRPEYAKRGF